MDFPVAVLGMLGMFVTAMLRASCLFKKPDWFKKNECHTRSEVQVAVHVVARKRKLLLTQLDVEKGKVRSFSVYAITWSNIGSDHTRCVNSEW